MNEKEPTLAQEAGLPDSWRPVDSKPIIPSELGAPGGPNKMAPLFSGPINPTGQHDVFFVGTQVGSPLIAKLPLTPMSASGLPTIGSAIQSGSSTTSSEIISVIAQGPNGAIQFNNGGALDGSVLLNWDNTSNIFTVTGTVSITGTTTMTGPLFVIGTAAATIFNAGTGFQVGSAAATAHYLRGNGTNFVSATLSGSDVLAGIVGVTYGGTGANLSATGGAHEVLQQTSVGGVVTVGQLAASDLSNGTTGSGAVVLAGSPTLTGTPAAPTPSTGDNSTTIATTAFVKAQGYVASPIISAIQIVIDGGGSPPSTGIYGQISIPYNCTILGWTLTADQSGSAVIDVLRSTYAGFPSTSSIAGSDKPTLSSVQKNTDAVLSGWGSTALNSGDELQFNLNSVTTCQRLNLTLRISIP